MAEFKKISLRELSGNPFRLIGDDWFLLTAGTMKNWNTMTAGWGTLGINWGKNVIIVFIRYSRYTFEFVENHDLFSCAWFDEEYREALNICGSTSGRDTDKAAETGLTPIDLEGTVGFKEARLQMICRKIYADDVSPECFADPGLEANYPNKDYHRIYFGEILKTLQKTD